MREDARLRPERLGRVLITQSEIQARVRELGRQISDDYAGKNPVLVSLLKGGFIFLADLIRHLSIPLEVDFVAVSSYRSGAERGPVEILNDLRCDVRGRDVILIEGIVDSGHTVSRLRSLLAEREARSLRVCALLDKPSARAVSVPVHYVGFRVPDVFVVGYGLDFFERYRNLSYIAELLVGDIPAGHCPAGDCPAGADRPAVSASPEGPGGPLPDERPAGGGET